MYSVRSTIDHWDSDLPLLWSDPTKTITPSEVASFNPFMRGTITVVPAATSISNSAVVHQASNIVPGGKCQRHNYRNSLRSPSRSRNVCVLLVGRQDEAPITVVWQEIRRLFSFLRLQGINVREELGDAHFFQGGVSAVTV